MLPLQRRWASGRMKRRKYLCNRVHSKVATHCGTELRTVRSMSCCQWRISLLCRPAAISDPYKNSSRCKIKICQNSKKLLRNFDHLHNWTFNFSRFSADRLWQAPIPTLQMFYANFSHNLHLILNILHDYKFHIYFQQHNTNDLFKHGGLK